MVITKDCVVTIDYEVKNAQGDVIDSSTNHGDLPYLHGYQNIIPGLEEALEGRKAGDHIDIHVGPEKGYGSYNSQLVQKVTREAFAEEEEVEVGMQFQAQTESGWQIFTITGLEGNDITIDGNHPLAGVDLYFNATVKEVRKATSEEIDHGHVHTGDDHHHS